MPEIGAILHLLHSRPDAPAALATLVGVEGSSYRRPGARLALLPDGARAGSVSGGCLETDLIERGAQVLATGRPEAIVYDTTEENDLVWGTGTGCGGRVRVLLEPVPVPRPTWIAAMEADRAALRPTQLAVVHDGAPGTRLGTRLAADLPPGTDPQTVFHDQVPAPTRLVVLGAGDDAQPVVALAVQLGWHVTVADSRSAFATVARFPAARAIIVAPAAETAMRVPLGPATHAVIMTHRYREDAALLRALLPLPLAYLGLLGPRHRTERLLEEINRTGFPVRPEWRHRLHAPVGLDLGGTTPETVALSIIAEIQARLAGRNGGLLRDRPGPIHA